MSELSKEDITQLVAIGALDHMEAQVDLLRREAALERRMFNNRAGAERLAWRADMMEFATLVLLS
ncbi:hypothetical protein ACU8OS_35335 (plasmid) [Rhizobium leguminosarum]